ncbi:MAG: hypothetical protein Q7R22_015260 [Verrucomicrobiota bacterium JB025]|nr:hypothetical protein [Verrucomicrobiota bacterium JB025]
MLLVLAFAAGSSRIEATTLTISDGDALFSYTDSTSGYLWNRTDANDVFSYGGIGDTLYQESWHLISSGDSSQPSGGSVTVSESGSSATMMYTRGLAGGLESLAITYGIEDTGSSALLSVSISATAGDSGASVSLVNYFDYDLDGFGDDVATYDAASGIMIIQDGGGDVTEVVSRKGVLVDGWEMASYSGLLTQIKSGGALSGAASTYGPGDFTGAMQWDIELDPNEVKEFNTGGGAAIGSETALGGAAMVPEALPLAPLTVLLCAGLFVRKVEHG